MTEHPGEERTARFDSPADPNPDTGSPSKGDEFRFPDGTVEVVVAVESDRVLTVTDYPNRERFHRSVESATEQTTNQIVIDLPGIESFQSGSENDPTDPGTDEEST